MRSFSESPSGIGSPWARKVADLPRWMSAATRYFLSARMRRDESGSSCMGCPARSGSSMDQAKGHLSTSPMSSFQSSGLAAMKSFIMLMHDGSFTTSSFTPFAFRCSSAPRKVLFSPMMT